MQTKTEQRSLDPHISKVATVLSVAGWLSLWVQLGLAAAAVLCLVFAISGRSVTETATPGIGIGVFWAIAGVIVLLFSLYLTFRLTRYGKQLRNPNVTLHPDKIVVLEVLRTAAIAGLVGMLLTILGGGATLGVLLAKSIAQPQGVAIYDPQRIIRSLDIFVAMANMNGITAHFVGAVSALALFNWLHRQ